MSQVTSIILVSTAVVAGIVGAVSLYLINDIRNSRHTHRTREGEQNLRLQLTSLQEELERLREEQRKNQEKNREKRKKRRGPRSVVSLSSDLDFKSVAETEFDSSSEEYFDFSTDAGDDDDDDVTLTEDVPQNNGEIKTRKDPFVKSLEEIDVLLFDGADEDMKSAYEILITLYNSRDILSDSNYAEVLWRLSKYCQRMANTFKKNNDNDRRKDIIYEGIDYGQKAISLDPENYNTHKWYAILVGMRNEFQGTSDKIKDGQIFYEHTNTALKLNPSDGSLYHLRGRFIVEIASLSWFEKKAASALFGELPPVTYDDAISDFRKAEELHEVPWKENKLMLAECYIAKGMYEDGATWLKNCSNIPNRTSDDEVVSIKLEELLKKYSSYVKS